MRRKPVCKNGHDIATVGRYSSRNCRACLCGRSSDAEYRASQRARVLMREYGITVEQYDKMLARQDGKCALCRRSPKKRRLDVDHDHKTNRVRGLLCFQCNKFRVGKNTVDQAESVVAYLRSTFDGRNL